MENVKPGISLEYKNAVEGYWRWHSMLNERRRREHSSTLWQPTRHIEMSGEGLVSPCVWPVQVWEHGQDPFAPMGWIKDAVEAVSSSGVLELRVGRRLCRWQSNGLMMVQRHHGALRSRDLTQHSFFCREQVQSTLQTSLNGADLTEVEVSLSVCQWRPCRDGNRVYLPWQFFFKLFSR